MLLLGSHFPSLSLRVFTVLVMALLLRTQVALHGTGRQGLSPGGDLGMSSRQIRSPVCGAGVGVSGMSRLGQEASFTR